MTSDNNRSVEEVPMISEQTTIVASDSVSVTEVKGELVLLDLDSGHYYGLNKVGAFVWNLVMQQPRTVGALHQAMMEKYDVPADVCLRDLKALLQKLLDTGVVRARDEALA